ncbi:hypothetical protein M0R45_014059 [Rubus argutus]|uniref:Pentatricopeptide repeat-containing protein n=1 Tax=Rubus argutus TaxID=59490 RepID=A0AAW1XKJ0_RUBAR
MAERVVEQVLKMVKPENDGGVYSLIADLYVLGGKWDDAERVRNLMVNTMRKMIVRHLSGSRPVALSRSKANCATASNSAKCTRLSF